MGGNKYMLKKPTDFEDQLAAMRRAFIDGLPGRIAEIDRLAATIGNSLTTATNMRKITELRMLVHKLAGAGGTFRQVAVGDAAGWVEQACDAIIAEEAEPTADQWKQVEIRLEKLRRAADGAVTADKRRKSA